METFLDSANDCGGGGTPYFQIHDALEAWGASAALGHRLMLDVEEAWGAQEAWEVPTPHEVPVAAEALEA